MDLELKLNVGSGTTIKWFGWYGTVKRSQLSGPSYNDLKLFGRRPRLIKKMSTTIPEEREVSLLLQYFFK